MRQAALTRGLCGAIRVLARTTPYVESELLGLRHVVGRGSVCVDVGAAAGVYTVVLSHLAGARGAVHSVEPLPFAHPVLSAIIRTRGGANVCRHTVALGAASGRAVVRVPLRRGRPVTGRSFLSTNATDLGSNREFTEHADVVVPAETLDGFCATLGLDRLDFLKVDVEGAELQVLEGGRDAIRRWRPSLLLEIEARHTARYGYRPEDLVNRLARLGYRMRAWRGGAWRPVGRVRDDIRNYLFVPDVPAGHRNR